MTREIRFRVWDIPNERMIDDPYYFRKSFDSYNMEKSDMEYAETWQDEEDSVWRSCFVMQFTGMKDKNGKEIWEGDIISRGNIVEFSYGSFNINGDTPLNAIVSRIEVIGNRYQNPELLS